MTGCYLCDSESVFAFIFIDLLWMRQGNIYFFVYAMREPGTSIFFPKKPLLSSTA